MSTDITTRYEDRVRDAGDGTASSRKSSSAGGSATPLRQTRAESDTPATPKTAAESLRAQLFQSTAKTGKTDRKKRGALTKIITSAPTGPEAFDHDPLEGVETTKTPVATIKGHGRKSSVARSLAGSFRTLGRRGTQSTKCESPVKGSFEDNLSPTTKQATSIPLPSSPVKIPAQNLNRHSNTLHIHKRRAQRSGTHSMARNDGVETFSIDVDGEMLLI